MLIGRRMQKAVCVSSSSELASFKRWLLPCMATAKSVRRYRSQDVLSDSHRVPFDRFNIANSPSSTPSTTLMSLLSPTELASLQQMHPSLQNILKLTAEEVSSGCMPSEVDDIVALLQACQEGGFQADRLAEVLGNLLVQRFEELTPQSLNKAVTYLNNLHEEELANTILLSSSKYILKDKSLKLSNNVIMSLAMAGNLNLEMKKLLNQYIISELPVMNLKFLTQLLSTMLQHHCLTHLLLSNSAHVFSNFLDSDVEKRSSVNLGKLFWVFGKFQHYDERLCTSISNYIMNGNDRFFSPWMMTAVVWYFARVRYYNPEVMERVAKYALMHVHRYAHRELSNLVYSFGYLNHRHGELMSAVARRLTEECSIRSNEQTYWMFVWSSMVMDSPFPDVLSLVLTEDFIKASLNMPDYQLCLLQLSIALNYEYPKLELSGIKTKFSKWGDCFSSLPGISRDYMKMSTEVRLKRYRHHDSALTFVENVKRALKVITGEYMYFNTEAMALCGYTLDFELLVDSKNKLIPIPRQWKMKEKTDVLNSIGVSEGSKSHKKERFGMSGLIDSMVTAESAGKVSSCVDHLVVPDSYKHRLQINLASDWGSKFALLKRKVSRKIAVEADGYPHFARNCDHVMGPTVLKHRQLKAMGWEVIQIPYREWQLLQTGDEHAQYLAKKIFES